MAIFFFSCEKNVDQVEIEKDIQKKIPIVVEFGFTLNDFQVVQGGDRLRSYASSPSVLRQFCGDCGSSLFWSRQQGEFADWISVALGTLDTTFTTEKQQHVEVTSKAPWFEIKDQWPQR